MKKRIVQTLLLSVIMVSLSASAAPSYGAEFTKQTDVAAQIETTKKENTLYAGVSNEINDMFDYYSEATIVKREDENLCESNNVNEYEIIDNEVNLAIIEMDKKMMEIDSITETKEWFIAYKTIIEEYSYILDPPESIYDYFTDEELDMLFSVVQAEIGDEYSFEQKCNVASVILNRINHYKFSDEMFEILTSDQFETINNGRYTRVNVSEDTILACEYVFMFGDTTNGALFFDSNNALKYEYIFNDGAHNFYKIKGE